jgi:hypothetical protein
MSYAGLIHYELGGSGRRWLDPAIAQRTLHGHAVTKRVFLAFLKALPDPKIGWRSMSAHHDKTGSN